MKFGVVLSVIIVTCGWASQCYGFCGGRKLNGDLARAAVQGNEFIRSQLADSNVVTFDYIRGAAFNSLRLGGFTIDMLTPLGLNDFGKDLDTQGVNNITTGRIAYYVLGVLAICKDPKSFRGHNLIARLEQGVAEYPVPGFNFPFQFSLAVLALCTSNNSQQFYRNYTLAITQMITDSINNNPIHSVDTVSMAIMALTCMHDRQPRSRFCYSWACYLRRKRSLRYVLRRVIAHAASWLRRQQRRDGSFGNSISTALAVQALLSAAQSRICRFSKYRCKGAMRFILGRQADDGSFSSPLVATTMQVTPVLTGAIFSDITNISCPQPKPVVIENITVCVQVEFLTSPTNGSAPANPPSVSVTVLNGTNAFNITKKAAQINPCYQFTTTLTAFGNSITSICGVSREPGNKKFWLIYSDPNTLAPTGIDNFKPKDGSCIIYRFEQLNFR